jgi:hypothetical protein
LKADVAVKLGAAHATVESSLAATNGGTRVDI